MQRRPLLAARFTHVGSFDLTNPRDPTGAQVRGQVQSGKTGDVRPGFDPAAAPMETDAEAGGEPTTPEQARIALDDHRHLKPDMQRNFDVAMREPVSAKTTSQTGRLLPVKIIVPVLIAAAVGMAVLSWWHA
jgi:hypothetical protein